METQVLSGILPISRVSAVSLCVYHAARLLPLEKIFGLEHPSLGEADARREDKRTWRGERGGGGKEREEEREREAKEKGVVWTAMDVLVAFALKKGWVTAKAGRPDINRAGNYSEVFPFPIYTDPCTDSITSFTCLGRRQNSMGVLASRYRYLSHQRTYA